jgi:hypothetical protein
LITHAGSCGLNAAPGKPDCRWQEWKGLQLQIETLNTELEQIASSDPSCVRLQQIPGVGPFEADGAAEKKIWRTLLRSAPAQIGENDRTLLEIAVVLKAKLEAGNIENSQVKQLIQCLTKLGMVPLTREAVPNKKDAAPNEWDEIDV